MILIRVGFLVLVLWIFGRFEWGAITAGQPLPLSWAIVMVLSFYLGEMTMNSMVLSTRREWQRLSHLDETPPRRWFWPVVVLMLALIVFLSLYGRISVETGSMLPQQAQDLRKAPWGIGIGFVVGFFAHAGLATDKMRDYQRRINAIKARQAHARAESEAEAIVTRQADEDARKGRAIAEGIWGKSPEPMRGSVPLVVPRTIPREREPMQLTVEAPKSAEREIVNGEWQLWSGERVLADNLAIPIAIHYRDIAGVETDRTVTVRVIIGKHHRDNEVTITKFGGHCDLRNADREFAIERILLASNPQTGVRIVAVGSWLFTQCGKLERVRPVETLESTWMNVAPITVELALDLSRGRSQALEHFTVTIESVYQPGIAFEGVAVRHKTDQVPGWKGRKRFSVAPDGTNHLMWIESNGARITDIPSWLAELPTIRGSTPNAVRQELSE